MRRTKSIVLLAWVAAALLRSQTTEGLITGRVLDSQTGRPVGGAQVSYSSLGTSARGVTETGSSGFYTLPLLSPGFHRIRVTAAGYQAQEVHELELPVAGRIELNLKLRPLTDVWEQGRIVPKLDRDVSDVLTASCSWPAGKRRSSFLERNRARLCLHAASGPASIHADRPGRLGQRTTMRRALSS